MCRKYYNKITSTHINETWREKSLSSWQWKLEVARITTLSFFSSSERVTLNTTGSDEGVSRKLQRRMRKESWTDCWLIYLMIPYNSCHENLLSLLQLWKGRNSYTFSLSSQVIVVSFSPFTSVLIITICVTKTLTIVYTVWWQSSRHTILLKLLATGSMCLFFLFDISSCSSFCRSIGSVFYFPSLILSLVLSLIPLTPTTRALLIFHLHSTWEGVLLSVVRGFSRLLYQEW